MLGLALGGQTRKMTQGHHGANHPVKDLETGKVEIVSMNHGFTVDSATLPASVKQTHVSLFDGTNCGLRVEGKDGLQRAIPPRSLARPDGFALSVRAVCRRGEEADLTHPNLSRPAGVRAAQVTQATLPQENLSFICTIVQNPSGWPAFAGHDIEKKRLRE